MKSYNYLLDLTTEPVIVPTECEFSQSAFAKELDFRSQANLKNSVGGRSSLLNRIGTISVVTIMLLIGIVSLKGQPVTQQYSGNGHTSAAIAPGSPAGSYSISDIENVNLSTRNLNVSIPLGRVGGRGAAGYTMTLPVEYDWAIQHVSFPSGGGQYSQWIHRYFPVPDWNFLKSNAYKYGPGGMRMQRATARVNDFETVPGINLV